MATERPRARVKRGRPAGRAKVAFALRLYPEQKRDLEILSAIMDGSPPVNGLIQSAIAAYVERKLRDEPHLAAEYERRATPGLRAVS